MKKVLIIVPKSQATVDLDGHKNKFQQFYGGVEHLLDDTQVLLTAYDDLEYVVTKEQISIIDSRNKLDLRNIDLVHLKNWEDNSADAPVIAQYLKLNGVAFFNSEVGKAVATVKIWEMLLLAAEGLPVPDTFFARKGHLHELADTNQLPDFLQYPFIMKANDGTKGDDNHLVRSPQALIDILAASSPEKEYILQRFIPNEGDFRILFTGLQDDPLVFHRKATGGSHLNNTSKGGTGTFCDLADIPQAHIAYAERAARVISREIGGVDLLVNKDTGEVYVLEVNSTPALATGFGVDVKMRRFAQFVKHALEYAESR